MIAPTVSPALKLPPVLAALLARPVPAVMGILNVTPDSFSDGGRFDAPERALAHARSMIADGADLIDVGAESTRPYGAQPVTAEEEWQRLAPVLPALVTLGAPISVDSMKASVTARALAAGAAIANDIWGLQRDPDMARVIAEHRAPVVVMHNRDATDDGIDIVADINAFFARSIEIALKAGIPDSHIILDPGIGFGKTPRQSLIALARFDAFNQFGIPVLIAASRKKFISSIVPSEPQERLGGTLAAHLAAVRLGARMVRAHDVKETVQALRVAAAIEDQRRASAQPSGNMR